MKLLASTYWIYVRQESTRKFLRIFVQEPVILLHKRAVNTGNNVATYSFSYSLISQEIG